MGDVNGERRLADTRLPGYRRDNHARAACSRTDVSRFEQGEEIRDFPFAAGEVSCPGGKLIRHGMTRRGDETDLFNWRDPAQGWFVGKDRALPFPDRGRFNSEIAGTAQRIQADGGGILPATVAVEGQRQIQL